MRISPNCSNVGQLVNAADGSIAAHYEYDPYGNIIHKYGTEADNNVYRFSTKYWDMETGLYYYGFRYYSSELGRWLTRDPIGEKGGMNLYTFCLNSPVNYFDLLGQKAALWEEIAAAIAGAIFLILPDKYSQQILIELLGGDEAVLEKTRKDLSIKGGPFTLQLWDHSVAKDSSAVIVTSANQHSWSMAVDLVKNSPRFKERSTFIKKRLKEGTDHFGHRHIEFNITPDLAYSIHGAQLWYKYNKSKCELKFWITDEYNFDKKHMWKHLQRKGKLVNFIVMIFLPKEKFNARR